MSWITPLGLLGLIGIAVLILIYLLKPNYQQKIISSTYVWRISLGYKKKKIPINKMRNILVFICQVLIITSCAFILTQPFIPEKNEDEVPERVVIIDMSASMLAGDGGYSRFQRAIEVANLSADEVYERDGVMTVITAGRHAEFLVRQVGVEQSQELYNALSELEERGCEYASCDIDGAIDLVQPLLDGNPRIEVEIYTGLEGVSNGFTTETGGNMSDVKGNFQYMTTGYSRDGKLLYDERFKLYNLAEDGEWNAAILDARAELVENWYSITVDIACYGNDSSVALVCDVYGCNGVARENPPITLKTNQYCMEGEKRTVVFDYESSGERIASFDYVHVYLEEVKDSYSYDNFYYLYGGAKETVRVQYFSSKPGLFIPSILLNWRSRSDIWDVEIVEIERDKPYETQGFDLYIFEHEMPEEMPTDGVVLLIDPDEVPVGLGVQFNDGYEYGDFNLAAGVPHPITQYLNPDSIYVSSYKRVTLWNGYDPIIYCAGDPILLVKNDSAEKVVLLAASLNMSDLSILGEFPILFYNMFDYFFPATVESNLYNVYDEVGLNARGDSLKITDQQGRSSTYHSVPAGGVKTPGTLYFPDDKFVPESSGVYTITQTLISGRMMTDEIFVRILSSESDITQGFTEFRGPSRPEIVSNDFDLIIFIAAALVALLFAEWWLQSHDQF